jgi:CDP-diacylglycerol--serine O-phosphatidyltransferase
MVSPADVFSFANALFGFLSIAFAIYGDLWLAVIFILLAALSDGADGLLARRIRSSNLGENMDSLADIISFFVAPSVLLLARGRYENLLILFSFSIYLFAALVRLSSFPIFKRDDFFEGLPLSAAGLTLVMLVILNTDPMIVSIALLLFSILMISRIRYPKVDNRIGLIALALIILVMVLRDFFYSITPFILLVALLIYIVFGPIYPSLNRLKQKHF